MERGTAANVSFVGSHLLTVGCSRSTESISPDKQKWTSSTCRLYVFSQTVRLTGAPTESEMRNIRCKNIQQRNKRRRENGQSASAFAVAAAAAVHSDGLCNWERTRCITVMSSLLH